MLLPLGVFAQAGANQPGSQSRPGQIHGSASTGARSDQLSFSSQSQQIERVSEDQLKNMVTADQLKGMKVVDRNGQKVGKVKHVGLSEPTAQTDQFRAGASSSAGSASGSLTASGSAPQSAGRSASQSSQNSRNSGQATLYIELDNEVRADGDDLASIPVSDVSFDQNKDEVKLQISRQDLAAQLR